MVDVGGGGVGGVTYKCNQCGSGESHYSVLLQVCSYSCVCITCSLHLYGVLRTLSALTYRKRMGKERIKWKISTFQLVEDVWPSGSYLT